MWTAVAAFTAVYNLLPGRDCKLFRLVRSPSPQTQPLVAQNEANTSREVRR